jgi:hypothetical protein
VNHNPFPFVLSEVEAQVREMPFDFAQGEQKMEKRP